MTITPTRCAEIRRLIRDLHANRCARREHARSLAKEARR